MKHNTTDEIVAIIGHELGHWHHSHTVKMLFISLVSIFKIYNCL